MKLFSQSRLQHLLHVLFNELYIPYDIAESSWECCGAVPSLILKLENNFKVAMSCFSVFDTKRPYRVT